MIFFAGWLADLPADVRVNLEPELRDRDGNVAREGTLDFPLRIDAILLHDDEQVKSVTIAGPRILSFEPLEVNAANLSTIIDPFTWDHLAINAYGPKVEFDWRPLKGWFARWFAEAPDPTGPFHNCVHFLFDPEHVIGRAKFEADLGSAPPKALVTLVDAFAECGATRLVLGDQDR